MNGTYIAKDLVSQSPQYRIDWLSLEPKVKKEIIKSNDQKPSQDTLKLISSFNSITKAILGNDLNQLRIVLVGLSSIPNVQHILSYLVKFLTNNIIKSNHSLNVLTQLLLSMRALSMNNGLHVATESFMSPLINSLLYCILCPTITSNTDTWNSDHWNFRKFAAFILAETINEWSSSFIYNKMYNQVILALTDCINDHFRPFSSHYGAIVAFTKLGLEVVLDHLYPSLASYLNFLQMSLAGSIVDYNDLNRFNAQKVFGAICNVAILLTLKLRQFTLTEHDEHQYSSNIYYEMYEVFGDSLSIRVPTDCEELSKLYYSPHSHKTKMCQSADIHQNGEDLFDFFYESKNNQSDDDAKSTSVLDSDQDKSNESEKDLAPSTDLLIKSTISDPTLGIKLTIKKVRRAEASSEESEESLGARNGKRKKKFKSNQLAIDFMFERPKSKVLISEIKINGK